MIPISSIVWAIVLLVVFFYLRVDFKTWLASRKPLATEDYEQFQKRLDDLQKQINDLAASKGYENDY